MDSLEPETVEPMGTDALEFRHIVERTQARLVRLALRILADQDEAEDAVQESYVKAHDALSRGRFDGRSSIETWLYRIVTRTAIDAARRRARAPRRLPEGDLASDATELETRLALRELSAWLSELPADQHAALLLKAVEGFSSAEIAEILECSEGAVEQRLVRARATLRRRAANDGASAPNGLFAMLTEGARRVPA